MEQRELFLGHMEDIAAKAIKTGCAASRFLTPAEMQQVSAHFARRRDVSLLFDGGYEGAERVRAVFLHPDWGEFDRTALFTALQVTVPPQETVGHRDLLGAVMALGIERDTIGDIIESPLVLLCLPELSDYIAETLTKAGRARIRLSKLDLQEIPARTENLSVKTDTVASLRFDTIVSSAFGLSRSKAVGLIEAGLVKLNHESCLQPAKEVDEGALLSVRGLGRAKLLECGGLSKKGRRFVKIGRYGKEG